MMDALFLDILNMAIAASWLILAVIAVRFVFRKAPKAIRVVLWSLVGLRLAWPFSWESVLSLIPSRETISPAVLQDAIPAIHSGFPIVNQAVNPLLSESLAPSVGASASPLQVITTVAAAVWLAGVAVLLLHSVISTVRLRRCVADAVRLEGNLWQSARIASPFVFGLFRPRIYLPLDLDGASLDSVVRHEQAHIRRRDHWIKPVGYLLLTVYWFNPLVWLAYHLLSRDIELACDERVVKKMISADRKAYSEALLACSVPRHQITACPLAFGEVGVKERIKNVLQVRKPAFWLIMAALLACILLAVCFLTDPRQEDADSPFNIRHLARIAAETQTLPADLSSESGTAPQTVDGAALAAVLENAAWNPQRSGLRLVQRDAEKSTESLEILLEDSVWLRVFNTDTVRIYAAGQERYYRAGPGDYEQIKALLGQASGAIRFADGVYAYRTCVYLTPISSLLPGLDSGYLYEIDGDSFRIIRSSSGEVDQQFTGIRWDFVPFTVQDWNSRFIGPPFPDVSGYREIASLDLSERFQLLRMDGELWLAHRTEEDKLMRVDALIPLAENVLTLQKVLVLARYGEHLAWEHLRPYARSDIGSGRYIYAFPIDENWRLTVNSGSGMAYGEKVPEAAILNLEYLPDQTGADLRQEDPAVFVARKESVRTGRPVVFSGTSLGLMAPANTQEALNEIRYDPAHGETHLVPFSVYLDGSEIYGGHYTITDAASGDVLSFFLPSGLPAHTYLLRNTQPGHRYRITFTTDDATYAFILAT
ncbi:MAG: M56 family metallopeptidase [Eubacteriales bacterium]|nr:M56 family metallopeptidase [Eubacteriales bacterium]